jgi:hypothetical protein
VEQPTQNAGPRHSSAEGSRERSARPGLDHSSPAGEGNRVLGPDGAAIAADQDFTSGFGRMVGRNPVVASAASLGVGLIIGMLVGAAVARD